MGNELYRIYSSLTPVVKSGETAAIGVTQTLNQGATALLHEAGPAVKIAVQGPQTEITESDISGVYPAPGSTDSPDDYLPHIALTRRTLPWERRGPKDGAPWLALLVISDFDMLVPLGVGGIGAIGVQPLAPPVAMRANVPEAEVVGGIGNGPPVAMVSSGPITP